MMIYILQAYHIENYESQKPFGLNTEGLFIMGQGNKISI